MVFNMAKSYTYEDVKSEEITYSEIIISDALDIISVGRDIPRDKVGQWVLDTYGGSLENAIINAFINMDWKKLAGL